MIEKLYSDTIYMSYLGSLELASHCLSLLDNTSYVFGDPVPEVYVDHKGLASSPSHAPNHFISREKAEVLIKLEL